MSIIRVTLGWATDRSCTLLHHIIASVKVLLIGTAAVVYYAAFMMKYASITNK